MNKLKCQAYTKKKEPCKNFAINGSHFCNFHERLFEGFPPVKITALMCPYCEKPIKKHAKSCKFCKNYFLICPYCDEPLRKDDESCSFCKENFNTVLPKPTKKDYLDKFKGIIRNRITTRGIDISYGCLYIIIFLFITVVVSIISISIYFELENL